MKRRPSPARAVRRAAFASPLLLLLLACGASGTESAKPTPSKRSAAELDQACADYARSLCEELGPSSDACRSVLAVLPLMPGKACAAGLDDFAATRDRVAELRADCQEVARRVCAELGEDGEACRALQRDLPDIPPGHCGALRRDAERLVAALRQRQDALEPVSEELWKAMLEGAPPGFGREDAAVTLVEFSDFQCPYCAGAAETVKKIEARYATRVRFVFRHFPLPFHPEAFGAAQAAVAAHEQGKFWKLHDAMFANQDALSATALTGHAKDAGLDVAAFEKAVRSDAARARVQHDLALGERAAVRGTPTLFVNRVRVDNALDFDAVAELIDAELATAAPAAPTGAAPETGSKDDAKAK